MKLGMDAVADRERALSKHLHARLATIPGLTQLALWPGHEDRVGVASFTLDGYRAEDLAAAAERRVRDRRPPRLLLRAPADHAPARSVPEAEAGACTPSCGGARARPARCGPGEHRARHHARRRRRADRGASDDHAAALIALQTRCGVAGMSMFLTPRCESASMTAFQTAGVEPIAPDSPMPLAPSGLRGDGVWVRSVSNDRQVAGARDRVGRQRAGHVVAVLVEGDLLVQRLRDALRDAAVDLALEQHLVVDPARVVDRDVPDRASRSPVSVSTSTTARCVPNGYVASGVSKSFSRGQAALEALGSRDGSAAAASCAHGIAEAGEPATPRPCPGTTWMSPVSASSRCAASRLAFSSTSSVARWTAVPPTCSEREPIVPMPRLTSLRVGLDRP